MTEKIFTIKNNVIINNYDDARKFVSENFVLHFGNIDKYGRAQWKLFSVKFNPYVVGKMYAEGSINFITNWAHVTDCDDLEVFISPDIEHGGIDELLVQMIEKRDVEEYLFNEPTIEYEGELQF
tara:strand:- start:47 stop:418 length:372 start_codon:yes stop_codon:yes gene_type:complete